MTFTHAVRRSRREVLNARFVVAQYWDALGYWGKRVAVGISVLMIVVLLFIIGVDQKTDEVRAETAQIAAGIQR